MSGDSQTRGRPGTESPGSGLYRVCRCHHAAAACCENGKCCVECAEDESGVTKPSTEAHHAPGSSSTPPDRLTNPEATNHAAVIRASLDAFQKGRLDSSWDDARAALDALLAERDALLESEAEWQRRGDRAVAAEASLTRYRNVENAARALYERVEMDESVGVCLSDRAESLALDAALAALDGPKEGE